MKLLKNSGEVANEYHRISVGTQLTLDIGFRLVILILLNILYVLIEIKQRDS